MPDFVYILVLLSLCFVWVVLLLVYHCVLGFYFLAFVHICVLCRFHTHQPKFQTDSLHSSVCPS
jgi:hypothetical protein